MDVLLRPAEVIGLGFDHSWKSIKVSKVHGPMAANLIADTTPNGDVHPAAQFLPHQSLGLTNRWISILRETLFLLVAGVGDSPLIQYSSYPSTYGKVEPKGKPSAWRRVQGGCSVGLLYNGDFGCHRT